MYRSISMSGSSIFVFYQLRKFLNFIVCVICMQQKVEGHSRNITESRLFPPISPVTIRSVTRIRCLLALWYNFSRIELPPHYLRLLFADTSVNGNLKSDASTAIEEKFYPAILESKVCLGFCFTRLMRRERSPSYALHFLKSLLRSA